MQSILFKSFFEKSTIIKVSFECEKCKCVKFNRGEYTEKPEHFYTGGFRCENCGEYADYASDSFSTITSLVNTQLTLF